MKKLIAICSLPLIAGCMAEPPREMSAEARTSLAAAMGGRVAGPPQNCVPLRNLRGNESAGEEAIIFRTQSSNLIYVNRPAAGCPEIGPGYALRTRTPSTQLCSGDIVEVFDPVAGFTRGACGLGEFVPYRRMR